MKMIELVLSSNKAHKVAKCQSLPLCVFRAQFGQLQYLVSFVRTMKLLAISVRPLFLLVLTARETLL